MSAYGPRSSTGIADPTLDAPGALPQQVPPRPRPAPADTKPAPPRTKHQVLINLARLAIVVLVIGLWQVLADAKVIDTFYMGEPSGVWKQLTTWWVDGTSIGPLWEQTWVTLEETLMGFGIGVTLGVVCGIVLGRLQLLQELFAPFIKTLNSIPRIVLGSVFAIWFGLGLSSKVALAVVLVFFSVFFNAFQGAREVDKNLIANARILGASRSEVTMQVVIPSALSWITTSLHIAFGLAITGSIVGELLGARQGIGLLISQAQESFDPNSVYAGLVVTATLALGAEGLITLLERRLLRWSPRGQQSGGGH